MEDGQDTNKTARKHGDLLLRTLCGAAALVVVLGGLRVAAPLITQFLMVVFIAIIVSPLYYIMRNAKFPHWLAVTLLILAIAGVLTYAASSLLPGAIMDFSGNIRSYGAKLQDVSSSFKNWLGSKNLVIPDKALEELVGLATKFLGEIGGKSISFLGNLTKSTVITLIIVAFVLAELSNLPDKVAKLPFMTAERMGLLVHFVTDVRRYMAIKSILSALTGLLVYGGLLALGVDSAGMLGIIAFFFNFVPVVGSLVAAVPGVLLALAGKGLGCAISTLILYLVVNQALGNIVEPRILGKGFGVSSVLVLISVIFWGWVLGPIGMLFAVPITIAVRSAFSPREGNEP